MSNPNMPAPKANKPIMRKACPLLSGVTTAPSSQNQCLCFSFFGETQTQVITKIGQAEYCRSAIRRTGPVFKRPTLRIYCDDWDRSRLERQAANTHRRFQCEAIDAANAFAVPQPSISATSPISNCRKVCPGRAIIPEPPTLPICL